MAKRHDVLEFAVLGVLCGVMGNIMATEAIKALLTPGHTAGTVSMLIPVMDKGVPHLAALWGGTGMQFSAADYSTQAARFRDIAAKAGADVLIPHMGLTTKGSIGAQTALTLEQAAKKVQAIADAAKRCAQYYINRRWLGGTLTNWKTISQSISRLRKLDEMLSSGASQGYTKKERLTLQRERDKLDRSLGGIKDMGGLPDMIFVIDTNKEDIAIQEAQRLNIPVAAIVDTNSDPKGITFVVPLMLVVHLLNFSVLLRRGRARCLHRCCPECGTRPRARTPAAARRSSGT